MLSLTRCAQVSRTYPTSTPTHPPNHHCGLSFSFFQVWSAVHVLACVRLIATNCRTYCHADKAYCAAANSFESAAEKPLHAAVDAEEKVRPCALPARPAMRAANARTHAHKTYTTTRLPLHTLSSWSPSFLFAGGAHCWSLRLCARWPSLRACVECH